MSNAAKRPGRATFRPSADADSSERHDAAIVVRPARRADVAAVSAIDAEITGLPKLEHWLELHSRQRRSAAVAGGLFLVAVAAEEPGRVVGFIVGEIRAWEFGSAPCGWVYALSVASGWRLRGVGETLLAAIGAQFRAAGIRKMRTMVARDNLLPMRFFRGEGMMAGPYIQLEKDLE
ncbi:MAG: GNAT family N-acetyltransferase [Steroidobacteraceae bacterium]|nr:GNAT family N-acetyltransferase [Steroidobacteraceae bacterium]